MTTQERSELLSCYSDLYKDLNGFRPSLEQLVEASHEELTAAVDSIAEDLRVAIEREAAEAEEHRLRTQSNGYDLDEGEYPTSGEGWALVVGQG